MEPQQNLGLDLMQFQVRCRVAIFKLAGTGEIGKLQIAALLARNRVRTPQFSPGLLESSFM
jgi:hypothetical protein